MTIILFLFFSLYYITYSYLELKVKTLPEDNYIYNKDNPDYIFYKSQLYKTLYTLLEIGNPSQFIPLFIKTDEYIFEITSINPSKIKNSSSSMYISTIYNITSLLKSNPLFNETISNTFLSEKCQNKTTMFKDCDEYCISNDSFIFSNKIMSFTKKLPFILVKGKLDSIPGEIGLGLVDEKYVLSSEKCFLNELKNIGIINNYVWYFNFNNWNNSEGKLIIGSTLHEDFPNIYSEKDLKYTKMIYNDVESSQNIEIKFDKIYIKENNDRTIFNNINVEFLFDSDVIITSRSFLVAMNSLFLYEYIRKGLCFTSKFYQYYINSFELVYFYCYENITNELYELIPSIKFFSYDFNYTFEITKDELFTVKDEYVYIRILFAETITLKWYLGRQFTMKFPFVFYPQNKIIGFYTKFKDSQSNYLLQNIWKYLTLTLIALLLSVFSIFIGMKIQKIRSSKKKKANELLDDYDYSTENINDENMESSKNNKDIEKNKAEEPIN